MKTVWKWPLVLTDAQVLPVPAGAQPLTVQMQGPPTLWALVDTDANTRPFEVRIVGTGNRGPDVTGFTYLGTVQDRIFVWHVFWRWQ